MGCGLNVMGAHHTVMVGGTRGPRLFGDINAMTVVMVFVPLAALCVVVGVFVATALGLDMSFLLAPPEWYVTVITAIPAAAAVACGVMLWRQRYVLHMLGVVIFSVGTAATLVLGMRILL